LKREKWNKFKSKDKEQKSSYNKSKERHKESNVKMNKKLDNKNKRPRNKQEIAKKSIKKPY